MVSKLNKLIEKGELSREQDDFSAALAFLDEAIIESVKLEDYRSAINAIGHHLLVYDRMYKQTKNNAFLELMYMDAQAGLRLAEKNNIHGKPLSVMLMRTAEYFLDTKDYTTAEKKYREAYDELLKDDAVTNEEQAEYLGHLAEAVIYGGDVERAEILFQQAHELLAKPSDKLRDFHQLIIESGLLLRESYGLFLNHQTEKAQTVLARIEPLVIKLKDEHKMDARYRQWIELKSKVNS